MNESDLFSKDGRPSTGLHERQKMRVGEMDSKASDEMERISKRSEELERMKQALRALRNKQDDFDKLSRELSDGLKRELVMLRASEEQAARAATVCHETRERFAALQDEIQQIDPERWTDEATYEANLTRALAQLEAARGAFNKGMDRVAATGLKIEDKGRRPADAEGVASGGAYAERTFMDWMNIGFAVAIPFAILAVIIIGACMILLPRA